MCTIRFTLRLAAMAAIGLQASDRPADAQVIGYGYGYGGTSLYVNGSYYGTPGIIIGSVTPYPLGYGYYYNGYPNYSLGYGDDFGYWGDAPQPLVIPADTIYGPGQVRQMMGLDPRSGTSATNSSTLANRIVNQPAPAARPALRASNQAARDLAARQLAIGDDAFRRQQYGDAWMAYKDSIRSAPDVADAYFHQAAAAVAQGRYEAAADTVRTGLRASTTYIEGQFKYTALYGENRLAHVTHLDALAARAARDPSSDLYFILGVMLFFDADPPRSAPFFERARQLAGADDSRHIDVFQEVLRKMAAENAGGRPAREGAAADGGRDI